MGPAEQTALQREIWRVRGERVGARYAVPQCPYSETELAVITASGGRMAYLPPELASQHARNLLGAIFPLLRCYAVHAGNAFPNTADRVGWFDYDAGIDAPYPDLDERGVRSVLAAAGRELLSLNQYIVASQDSQLLTGQYLDERRTWARVGTTFDGHAIAVRFDGPEMAEGLGDEEPVEGSLLVAYDLHPDDHGGMLGARTTSAGRARDLDLRWHRQTDAYVAAGFAERLGMTARDYLASLPAFPAQPDAYRGRLDLPLVVETRIPWREQADLLGVVLSSGSRSFEYVPVDDRSRGPGGPYAAWFTTWAQRFPDPIAPADALARLAGDEVGATVHDLLAAQVVQPGLSESGRFFEAIGQIAHGMSHDDFMTDPAVPRVPCLYHWRGRPEIGANLHPVAFSIFRPLVRGTRIATVDPKTRPGNDS